MLATVSAAVGRATIEVLPSSFVDTDNDGMDDGWETDNGLIVGEDDSGGDADMDGQTNLNEYLSCTDPQDANSALRITNAEQVGPRFQVTFSTVPGKTYTLQQSADGETWADVPINSTVTATGTEETLITNFSRAIPMRFFRVVLQ